jgi:tetracycline 7-halogenase / FADH2 O2-dependent halogenase
MSIHDVAIIGSGPGGTILARILRSRGLSVALIEREEHPRFAIGESSTPLSNLSLERLAHRYGLVDLWHLAQHGRWLKYAPEVARGLKRGFTFYRHRPREPLGIDPENSARLLVAASPDDEIADTHWYRADVDHFLVRQAIAEGVDYRPRTRVCDVELGGDDVTVVCEVESGAQEVITARFVVDASGSATVMARALGIPDQCEDMRTHSGVIGTHFLGLPTFQSFLESSGRNPSPGPYPEDWAAVHHWIDEGWIYSLRFDDGRVSAGLLLEGNAIPPGAAGASNGAGPTPALWRQTLARYPDLDAYFSQGTACEPWLQVPRLQRLCARATGARWAMLPYAFAFVDPMFSAGLAWTLRGVERLADAILESSGGGDPAPSLDDLARYEDLLKREAVHVDQLIAGSYATRSDFRLTAAHAMLYFAAVSWSESLQRLGRPEADCWRGFLGVGDPLLDSLPADALGLLEIIKELPEVDDAAVGRFTRWVTDAIEGRNVAGLCDQTKANLYPVDMQDLVRSADLLGMTTEQVEEILPGLRGTPHP